MHSLIDGPVVAKKKKKFIVVQVILELLFTSPVPACGVGSDHASEKCISTTFSVHSQFYNGVCGCILGYQNGFTGALYPLIHSRSIEEFYLYGEVSLTHGSKGSRQHSWSFANANTDYFSELVCQCSSNVCWLYNTSFAGNDYFLWFWKPWSFATKIFSICRPTMGWWWV